MGQRGEEGGDRDVITDDASKQHTDDAQKKLLLQKVKLSGNFRNYKEMKLKQFQAGSDDRNNESTTTTMTSSDDVAQSKDDDEHWNHFTTPLKPSSTSPNNNNNNLSDSSQSAFSTTEESETRRKSSVFSDLERTQTIDRFGDIFMTRMGNVMSSGKLSTAWGGGSNNNDGNSMFSWLFVDYSPNPTKQRDTIQTIINPEDYAAERRMITPHLTPFVWGGTTVAVTLFSLRFGRWYQGRQLGRAAAHVVNNSGSRLTHTTTTARNRLQDLRTDMPPQSYGHSSSMGHHPSSYQSQKNAMLSNLSTLPVDMAISLLVGISTSIFLTRPADLLNDLSNAPLLQGKSVLREELCPPFTEEMERINQSFHAYTPSGNTTAEKQVVSFREMWREENMGDFDSLKAIRNFVENCYRQRAVSRDEEQESR